MSEIDEHMESEGIRPSRAQRRASAANWSRAERRMRMAVREQQSQQAQRARKDRLRTAKSQRARENKGLQTSTLDELMRQVLGDVLGTN